MQLKYFHKKLILVLVMAITIVPAMFLFSRAEAQFSANNLAIEIFPNNPSPNEKLIISVSSFGVDLSRTEIVWSVNGKVANRGVGLTTFSIVAPDVGGTSRIDVSAKTNVGTLSKSITIRPAGVEILWYSHGHTPPLYKGKTLHTSETALTVSAIPHFILGGVPLGAESLFYEWRRNGKPLLEQSGLGKQTISFIGSMLFGKDTISVIVSTKDKAMSGASETIIETVSPDIVFYENNPLAGTRYEQSLTRSYFLKKQELTIRAEPYFFSKKELANEKLNSSWTVNETQIKPDPAFTRQITLRQTGGSGEAVLSYAIATTKAALQDAVNSIKIIFGE